MIGGAGSVLRFYVDGIVAAASGRDFPYGTLAVNLSGAVILGLLTGLALSGDAALLAGTAAVGSYTTFSTWMLETQRLTEERQHRKAVAEHRRQPGARRRRRGARPADRTVNGPPSERGRRQAHQLLRRAAADRGDGFAADALLDLYGRHEVATSILLRGAEGFGAKRHPRTDMSLTLSEDLPLIAVAVDSRPRIEPLVEPTARLTGTGLVTLERARLLSGDIETGDIEA